MKLQLFLGGLFIGMAIGLMLGGYMVEIPEDVTEKRQYPQGIALLLALIGAGAFGSSRRADPSRSQSD